MVRSIQMGVEMENIINNNMENKPNIGNRVKRIGKWLHLVMLRIEHDTIELVFSNYEQKVIAEEVNTNSLTYKLWLNIIEKRQEKIHEVIMDTEIYLGIFNWYE